MNGMAEWKRRALDAEKALEAHHDGSVFEEMRLKIEASEKELAQAKAALARLSHIESTSSNIVSYCKGFDVCIGNSDVETAIKAVVLEREALKTKLASLSSEEQLPEKAINSKYLLRLSQEKWVPDDLYRSLVAAFFKAEE